VARQIKQNDGKVPSRAALARRGRDIFRERQAVARRRTAGSAKVARRKENNVGRNCTREKLVLKTSKGWTLGKRQRVQQQCNRGTRIETYRKTTGRETVKRITESPVPSQNIKNWTLSRGRNPPKRKRKMKRLIEEKPVK
jgi:hypothetical protein